MARYFHGTTSEGLRAILSGYPKPRGPWTCSAGDATYLWDVEKLTSDPIPLSVDQIIVHAFKSAQIQAAIRNQDDMLYVVELELDPALVEDDVSCDNMAAMCSVVAAQHVGRSSIVRVLTCPFDSENSPHVLAEVIDLPVFDPDSVSDGSLLDMAGDIADFGNISKKVDHFKWLDVRLEDVSGDMIPVPGR